MRWTGAMVFMLACKPAPSPVTPTPVMRRLVFLQQTPTNVELDDRIDFELANFSPGQAYRITLVSADHVIPDVDGTGVFMDADGNGTADPGPSEEVGQISHVNFSPIDGGKTYPEATDDPAAPSGLFSRDGLLAFGVESVGPGSYFPVVYPNAGVSTFLEIDGDGTPVEPYALGPRITVVPPPGIQVVPSVELEIPVGESRNTIVSGLDDRTAYRVTLVLESQIVRFEGGARFADNGAGVADAGPSEAVALITNVNGDVLATPFKTVPEADDDPQMPTGVFPIDGRIQVSIQGHAAGRVVPVVYENGGGSTFLEIDGVGVPVETYALGGTLNFVSP